jgi:hypothetical protein
MKTFYVIQVIENNEPKIAIDYPKDFPIPNVGDELIIKDEKGWEHKGNVTAKRFVIREYRELNITLNCG